MEHTAASLTFVIWTFLLFGALKCYQKGQEVRSTYVNKHEKNNIPICDCHFNGHNRFKRIIGGSVTQINSYKYVVGLFSMKSGSHRPFCSGVLINSRYVVTAAHCFTRHDYHETKVDVGDFNIETDYEVQNQIFTVESIYIHWGFNSQKETFVNDIALLKLDKNVDFSRNVWPVCLVPQGLEIPDETVATVLGWGNIEKSGHGSKKLRKANLKIYDDESCGRSSQILQLCAGDKSGQRDACQGDSGGPLVVTVQHAEMLVGIVSYGSGCAKSGASGGYTKISQYTDWIEKFSQSDIQCSAHVLHETDLPWQ